LSEAACFRSAVNLIEPIAMGRPTLVGPHMFNFTDATDKARAAGAALGVSDAAALITEVNALPAILRDTADARGRHCVPCRAS
jgi:3-deoxy-D-manno-octulosonic-acid transferase